MINMESGKTDVRVLIVDDNQNDYDLMVRMLETANGFIIHSDRVETEEQVLHALHTKPWDIILCDYSLPGLDAARVLRIIEDLEMEIPFILISGTIREGEANEMMRALDLVNEFVDKQHMSKLRGVFHRQLNISSIPDQILDAWMKTLEFRDNETAGHSGRVVETTLKMARKVGISETRMTYIKRGASLHDVGKMGIPDSVLLKPGLLDAAEMEIMKQHPMIAEKILAPIKFLLKSVAIPIYHHERWDGTGYPYKLKGEQIPIEARIFSIVDVYDALTSNRPYREAWSKIITLSYIESMSGTYFDPTLVPIFIKMME